MNIEADYHISEVYRRLDLDGKISFSAQKIQETADQLLGSKRRLFLRDNYRNPLALNKLILNEQTVGEHEELVVFFETHYINTSELKIYSFFGERVRGMMYHLDANGNPTRTINLTDPDNKQLLQHMLIGLHGVLARQTPDA